jgi:DNA sulfur modification protein DndD
MIINQVTFSNFRPFYGSQTIEFSKGVNLINAQQGGGKTSMFSAFYWCLFNKIYNSTDKEWLENPNYESVFNKQAIQNNDQQIVECSVSIDLDKIDALGIKKNFNIIRKITLRDNGNGGHEINKSLVVYYNDELGSADKEGEEASALIEEKIFPKSLSDYIWFQGEFLNRLIDLDNSNSFKRVIDTISYIEYYDRLNTLFDNTLKKNSREKVKKAREIKKGKAERKEIEYKIDTRERRLEKIEKFEKPSLTAEYESFETQEHALRKKIVNNDRGKSLLKDLDDNLQSQSICRDKMASLDEKYRDYLGSKWMMKGLEDLIIKAKEKLYAVEMEFTKAQDEAYELPIHTPDDQTLLKMLEKEVCLVCESSAPKGSERYQRIKNLIGRATNAGKVLDPTARMIDKAISEMNRKPDRLVSSIQEIEKEISKFDDEEQEIQNEINLLVFNYDRLKNKKEDLENELQIGDLKVFDIDLSRNADNLSSILGKKASVKRRLDDLQEEENKLKVEIQGFKKQFNKLISTDEGELEEIKIEELLESLKFYVEKTKKIEYENLVKDIEKKANEYLQKALEKNSSIKVQILINPATNQIQRIDKSGNSLDLELNTGHDALINLCLIMAIIDKSSSYSNQSYAFLADAPTSSLDPIVSLDWTYLNSEVFEQSIILNKDLINYEEDIVKSKSINSVFRLETDVIDSTKGEGIENQYSKIIKIK